LRSWPYPAKPAEPGLESFYPSASPLFACASVKISYALQPHRPPLFCRFSAEAFLLSGLGGHKLYCHRGRSLVVLDLHRIFPGMNYCFIFGIKQIIQRERIYCLCLFDYYNHCWFFLFFACYYRSQKEKFVCNNDL